MQEPSTPENPPPQIAFLPVRSREEAVTLEWPLQHGDRRIDTIVVRRMTVADVAAYIEVARDNPKAAPPNLFFPDGEPVPAEVIDALDADDDERLLEVTQRFLPLRLRRVSALFPSNGGATSPLSQAD